MNKQENNPDQKQPIQIEEEDIVKIIGCPFCNKVPTLDLDLDNYEDYTEKVSVIDLEKLKNGNIYVHISCPCMQKREFTIAEEKQYNIVYYDDTSSGECVRLCYMKLKLNEYIEKIENQAKIENFCTNRKFLFKKVPAFKYCFNCSKWYCDECLSEHSESSKEHFTIKSQGFIIPTKCELEACPLKGNVSQFCLTCKKHICSECNKVHTDAHKTVQISSALDSRKKENIPNNDEKNPISMK